MFGTGQMSDGRAFMGIPWEDKVAYDARIEPLSIRVGVVPRVDRISGEGLGWVGVERKIRPDSQGTCLDSLSRPCCRFCVTASVGFAFGKTKRTLM